MSKKKDKTKRILTTAIIIFMALMLVFAFSPFLFMSPQPDSRVNDEKLTKEERSFSNSKGDFKVSTTTSTSTPLTE